MHLGTKLYTFFFGKLVGKDKFGNSYYEDKKPGKNGKHKRWVMYNGSAEPSKVPPSWHGWLHYTFDQQLECKNDHVPNLTGTDLAYFPPGHENQGGNRDHVSSDYEPWQPN